MYADDTAIYTSDKSFSTIKSNLTENFALVANWLEENQLTVSKPEKGEDRMHAVRDVVTHKKQNT